MYDINILIQVGRMKNKLKQLIDDKGVSQIEVSRATGLNKTTINRFYRGYTDRLDLNTIKVLCKYFGLSRIDDLISLED